MKRVRMSRRRGRIETAAAPRATEVADAIEASVRSEGEQLEGRETAAPSAARETR